MKSSATAIEPVVEGMGLEPLPLRPLDAQPLVSVLVANYNYERFIGEALDSVLGQTYQNFEVVICDDGSTDSSLEIIESYEKRDGRIRHIEQANGGHGAALNAAFSACGGEIVCLLDSDDLFLPGKLERVVSCFRDQRDAGISLHRVLRVNEARRPQGVWPLYGALPDGWRGQQLLDSGGVLPYLPPTSGLSFRREVAEQIFPLPTYHPVGACPDQVMMRLAPLISSIAKLDDTLAEYRVHGSNTYATNRRTVETVSREISLGESLWKAQRDFLARLAPELASGFEPIGRSGYFLLLKYVRSRLSGDGSADECYAAFIADVQKNSNPRYVWFWRSTRIMPKPVFAFAINLLMGQGAVKQLLARIKGLV
ncbi:MAG: glycosyltransferase family 2 protein [Bryobacteraceae bacterium]